ncbi:MAG: hypothetical protein BJ554DRAFT_5382, partial [Olpidium bornovanus]
MQLPPVKRPPLPPPAARSAMATNAPPIQPTAYLAEGVARQQTSEDPTTASKAPVVPTSGQSLKVAAVEETGQEVAKSANRAATKKPPEQATEQKTEEAAQKPKPPFPRRATGKPRPIPAPASSGQENVSAPPVPKASPAAKIHGKKLPPVLEASESWQSINFLPAETKRSPAARQKVREDQESARPTELRRAAGNPERSGPSAEGSDAPPVSTATPTVEAKANKVLESRVSAASSAQSQQGAAVLSQTREKGPIATAISAAPVASEILSNQKPELQDAAIPPVRSQQAAAVPSQTTGERPTATRISTSSPVPKTPAQELQGFAINVTPPHASEERQLAAEVSIASLVSKTQASPTTEPHTSAVPATAADAQQRAAPPRTAPPRPAPPTAQARDELQTAAAVPATVDGQQEAASPKQPPTPALPRPAPPQPRDELQKSAEVPATADAQKPVAPARPAPPRPVPSRGMPTPSAGVAGAPGAPPTSTSFGAATTSVREEARFSASAADSSTPTEQVASDACP